MDWIFLIMSLTSIVVFIFSFTKGKAPLRYLFYFWIATFHIGPRAIAPMGIKIFFCEGFTFLVFFLFLIRSNFYASYKKVMPSFTWFVLVACMIGVLMAFIDGRDWRIILYEVKPFICMVPVFYITHFGLKHLNIKLSTVFTIIVIGCLILGAGGAISYFFPAVTKLIPVNLTEGESVLIDIRVTKVDVGGQVFIRGGASFWGLLIVSGYLALLLFPVFVQGSFKRGRGKKFIYYGTCILMVVTIILCAHRSVWIGCLAGVAMYSYFKGAKGLFRGAILLALACVFLPENIYLRLISVTDQTKWAGRVGRYNHAWKVMVENPLFGKGWGASGWAHNAFLQLGANLGIFGLFAFFVWLRKLFFLALRVYRTLSSSDSLKMYILSFLVSLVVYMGPMLGESVITWTFMMIPFWFLCAILHNVNNGTIVEWV